MKILHLLPELNLGGVERYVVDMANCQVACGHDVTVCSAGGTMERELCGVSLIHEPVKEKNPVTALAAARHLAAAYGRGPWDVAVAHSRVPAFVAWRLRALTGLPFVQVCHSLYSLNAGLMPLRRADGALCVSAAVRDHLAGRLPGRHCVVVNGIACPSRMHQPHAPRENLLFVGRLTDVKGLDTLLRALALCTQAARLTVCGDGPKGESYRALAQDLGVSRQVQWLGACTAREVAEQMATCGLLVLPSRQEGFSLVRSQGAVMGVPMLLSDVAANREVLQDRSLLLAPDEPDLWAKAIDRWIGQGTGAVVIEAASVPSLETQVQAATEFFALCAKNPRG